ncbi:hypothetical protein SAMN05518672_10980 [Chitinophaga sp. CF118]|uniref:hypothetical protein n=1 Tax=Chitinophaga sp. CF118 TaxID=1884367 RepID=UPI0008F14B3F|nr:hypothetical protein [Chitinophaga sp. CF118]SFE68989.1 hypothetical protein SAMN05518672_10980 [Chitinophaga sp. CF118]
MLHDKSSGKHKESEEYNQKLQKQVKILKTDQAGNGRNPLHGNLSGKPEDENKAVRNQISKRKD